MNNSINTDRPDFEAIVKKASWKVDHGCMGMWVVSEERCEELIEDAYNKGIEPLLSTVKRLQEENEWISVKDRLPGTGGLYLIHKKPEPNRSIEYLIDVIFYTPDNGFTEFVTHWQRLPKPPIESLKSSELNKEEQ